MDQKAGQGMAGQCPLGRGNRWRRSSRVARASTASTSAAVIRLSSCWRSGHVPPARQVGDQPGQCLGMLRLDRVPGPAPQHGAQLVLGVQADAVVDPAHRPVGADEHVSALAVGVVEHRVQHRHPAQLGPVGVHQADLTVGAVGSPSLASRMRSQPSGMAALGTTSTRLTAGSVSTHSWHIPGPNGPSRSRVGGTRSQPVARETGRRRPPARPACRPGSPTAVAPPRPACRPRRR